MRWGSREVWYISYISVLLGEVIQNECGVHSYSRAHMSVRRHWGDCCRGSNLWHGRRCLERLACAGGRRTLALWNRKADSISQKVSLKKDSVAS